MDLPELTCEEFTDLPGLTYEQFMAILKWLGSFNEISLLLDSDIRAELWDIYAGSEEG